VSGTSSILFDFSPPLTYDAIPIATPHNYHTNSHAAYLLLYVNDIIITASSQSFLDHVISQLHIKFSMKDLSLLHHLGIQVIRDSSDLFLSQR
jgi:hypothetical protein